MLGKELISDLKHLHKNKKIAVPMYMKDTIYWVFCERKDLFEQLKKSSDYETGMTIEDKGWYVELIRMDD